MPFDLATGPLLRASVLRLAPEKHLVVLAMHHVVGDEWSGEILRRELDALYRGRPLPELPVQYADFAVWQREWLSGAVLDGQLAYWRERAGRSAGAGAAGGPAAAAGAFQRGRSPRLRDPGRGGRGPAGGGPDGRVRRCS